MTHPTVACSPELANKALIDESLWNRLTVRIMREKEVDEGYAKRVMDQALGFLRLCAAEPSVNYGPSKPVDLGWHTFILYTREYAQFCNKLAGQFIHHAPSDALETYGAPQADTVAAMERHGISVDHELWPDLVGDCYGDQCRGSGDGSRTAA